MRSILRLAASAALGLLLGGCIAFGDIDNRATTINQGVGATQNRALLLNLARASRSEPLYFLSLAQINGSSTEDLKIGAPAVTFGPNQTVAQHQYTVGGGNTNVLDNQTLTSFQLGLLGSKDFYAGLMAPLGLDDINLLFNQGFSRELVLYLVVDRLTVTDVTHLAPDADDALAPTQVYYNDPANETNYEGFEKFIGQAMVHGLTTEPTPYVSPAAGQPSGEDSKSGPGKPGGDNGPPVAHAQLCYDWALATEDAKKDFPNSDSRCGAKSVAATTTQDTTSKLAVNLGGEKYEIDVKMRSIFGIFTYLGSLIEHQELARVHLRHYDLPNETTVDAPLLTVLTDGAVGSTTCFTAVDYDGSHYCVPEDGADNTKKIFNILNALLALKTSQGDLPVTQTVRITP